MSPYPSSYLTSSIVNTSSDDVSMSPVLISEYLVPVTNISFGSCFQPGTVVSVHGDDNHSQTSGETVTSDSGRGGSESDIHSASLSHSHDSGKHLNISFV